MDVNKEREKFSCVHPVFPGRYELTRDIILFSPIIGPRARIRFFSLKSIGIRSFSCLTGGPFFRYVRYRQGLNFPSEAFQKH
jgi:hypothetical protein